MTIVPWKRFLLNLVVIAFLPALILAALLPGPRRKKLIWGSTPVIGFKYWSEAMREVGWDSMTIMGTVYGINSAKDYDRMFVQFAPSWLPQPARFALGSCLALLFVLRRARVLHISVDGFALGPTWFWRFERRLVAWAGIKIVVLPYGGDGYIGSRLVDTSIRYALNATYPHLIRQEDRIARRITFWTRHADAMLVGLMIDGMPRWDVTTNQIFVVDTRTWQAKTDRSMHDGRSGPVRVLHAPNHRGAKGTEFVIDAVERLKAEGLQVELVLLEKVPNDQVRGIMQDVDILAEQFIFIGYGINGLEGLASGLPVMANLEHPAYTQVFRRFGFLDECPILSTTPETLADNLRLLVQTPQLRQELGQASRAFAEKYQSYATAQYMFGAVYDRILFGKEVDLINLFHPLMSPYNKATPKVAHPLIENKLPADWRPE